MRGGGELERPAKAGLPLIGIVAWTSAWWSWSTSRSCWRACSAEPRPKA